MTKGRNYSETFTFLIIALTISVWVIIGTIVAEQFKAKKLETVNLIRENQTTIKTQMPTVKTETEPEILPEIEETELITADVVISGEVALIEEEVKPVEEPITEKQYVENALTGCDPTEELLTQEAIRLGLNPEVYASGGALFFYSPENCSETELIEREGIKVKIQIGDHVFYKVWG